MKSDVIRIDNRGGGFDQAVQETKKTAEFRGVNHRDAVQLQLMTEELLSMARSVTGEMQASFWLESEDKYFELHLSTKTVMDSEKRRQLISASTSRKNEAAASFLGRLRDAFEQAMAADVDHTSDDLPEDVIKDLPYGFAGSPEWDRYEQSILRRLADEVKIFIRGGLVNMTVTKRFAD